ncbi:VIP36-like protein isoform X2 [Oncorhynchus mykiss]|uniref:VIP36-like protein isoform X2 n=1 Tax=Oncorhynchus mykiss TaxID=8022 RepID=UPI0018781031|nr:VIP36-like protein isoform X2 [Oncorhynchus mykiss]
MGDAMVTTEQVRLTSDMQSKQRAVWSRIDLFTGLGVLVDTYPNEEKHLETGAEDEVHHTHTEDLPLCVGDGVCTAMLRNHNHNTFIFIRYVRGPRL